MCDIVLYKKGPCWKSRGLFDTGFQDFLIPEIIKEFLFKYRYSSRIHNLECE